MRMILRVVAATVEQFAIADGLAVLQARRVAAVLLVLGGNDDVTVKQLQEQASNGTLWAPGTSVVSIHAGRGLAWEVTQTGAAGVGSGRRLVFFERANLYPVFVLCQWASGRDQPDATFGCHVVAKGLVIYGPTDSIPPSTHTHPMPLSARSEP